MISTNPATPCSASTHNAAQDPAVDNFSATNSTSENRRGIFRHQFRAVRASPPARIARSQNLHRCFRPENAKHHHSPQHPPDQPPAAARALPPVLTPTGPSSRPARTAVLTAHVPPATSLPRSSTAATSRLAASLAILPRTDHDQAPPPLRKSAEPSALHRCSRRPDRQPRTKSRSPEMISGDRRSDRSSGGLHRQRGAVSASSAFERSDSGSFFGRLRVERA